MGFAVRMPLPFACSNMGKNMRKTWVQDVGIVDLNPYGWRPAKKSNHQKMVIVCVSDVLKAYYEPSTKSWTQREVPEGRRREEKQKH